MEMKRMSEKKKKVENTAEKAGEVVGRGIRKGAEAVNDIGKGIKKGLKKKNRTSQISFSHKTSILLLIYNTWN